MVILIDDDELIHYLWKFEADKRGVPFKGFCSISEFLESADDIALDSEIYIDSHLGDDVRGEIEGVKVFEAGFKNICVATGYDSLAVPSWVKAVVGKGWLGEK